MEKKSKSFIQFAVLFSISIVLVWLSISSVWDKRTEIINSFKTANYFWVGFSIIIAFISHWLRAFRWNYLLKPLGYSVKPINAMGAVLVGYFANYGLPRMGEISRCTLVTKYDKVPFEVALGTVITERIVDVLLLLFIFVLTLFAQFAQLKDLANEYIFNPLLHKLTLISENPTGLIILLIFGIACVVGFLLIRKKVSNLLKGKFGSIISGFGKGLSSIKDIDKKFQFIALSFSIWIAYYYSLYVCFFAFTGTSHLGHSECLVLLLFGTFGVAFSAGGLGAYQAIITGLLIITYHIDTASAVAFPWMAWASQFILIVVLGVISLIILPIVNKQPNNEFPSTAN